MLLTVRAGDIVKKEARHILCCVIKTVAVDFLKQGTRKFMHSIRRRGPSHQYAQVADSQTTDYSPYEAVATWFTVFDILCGYNSASGTSILGFAGSESEVSEEMCRKGRKSAELQEFREELTS